MGASNVIEAEWWHLAIIIGLTLLLPLFRALAVVLVARAVDPNIAKLAIPLILTPWRASLFPKRKHSVDKSTAPPTAHPHETASSEAETPAIAETSELNLRR